MHSVVCAMPTNARITKRTLMWITLEDQPLWSLSGLTQTGNFCFSDTWFWYQKIEIAMWDYKKLIHRFSFNFNQSFCVQRYRRIEHIKTGFNSIPRNHHGKTFDRTESQRTERNSLLLNSLFKRQSLKKDFLLHRARLFRVHLRTHMISLSWQTSSKIVYFVNQVVGVKKTINVTHKVQLQCRQIVCERKSFHLIFLWPSSRL